MYGEKKKSLVREDDDTYHLLARDPTTRVEKKVSDAVKNLHRLGHIEDDLKRKLDPKFSCPPQMYGLPKVHKDHIPLRLIVSAIGSPTYSLAKELARILALLAGNTNRHVKNSAEFANIIRDAQLDETDYLFGFDVVSLFTRVPLDEALQVIANQVQNDPTLEERTSIPAEDILTLTELCLRSTYFQLEEQFYEQVEGAAMGSPLSPITANLYMEGGSRFCPTPTQSLAEVRG